MDYDGDEDLDRDPDFNYNPDIEDVTLPEIITLFDDARLLALGAALDPGADWAGMDKDAVQKYIALTLCGTKEGDDPVRYNLDFDNAYQDVYDHPDAKVMKDIDSALVFGSKFFYTDNYDIMTTFDAKFTLGGHLHCKVPFTNPLSPDENVYRDPGDDTAVFWGKCGIAGRDRIHLMLPDAGNVPLMEIHSAIYAANLTAAKEILPDVVKQWSPDYQTELSRTGYWRPNPTRRTQSTHPIRGGDIDEVNDIQTDGALFGTRVMEIIRTYDWGKHAYWFLQIRGAKDLTRHTGGSANTEEWIQTLLTYVHEPFCAIYLDMAVELHLPAGYSSLIRRGDETVEGLAETLFNVPPEVFDTVDVEPDVWAGVQQSAGFRANFTANPVTVYRISYIQAYTTDKFQTYNVSSFSSKSMKLYPQTAFKMKTADDIPVSYPLVYDALLTNLGAKTPGAVRVEVRVPRSQANAVFALAMEPRDFQGYTHIVKNEMLWAWRLHKICACLLLLRYAASCRRDTRAHKATLLLVAATTFVFNSMHSRPMEMGWDRQVGALILPIGTVAQSSENKDRMIWASRNPHAKIPMMLRGALWLPPITFPVDRVGDVLRFEHNDRWVTEPLMAKVYNMPFSDLENRYGITGVDVIRPGGVLKKRNVLPAKMILSRTVVLPPGVKNLDLPAIRGFMDAQPDLPASLVQLDTTDPNLRPRNAGHLFLALISGVIQKIGQSNKLELCKLSDADRQLVGFGTFQDMNLSTYFSTYMYQVSTQRWAGVRERLIPALGDTVSHAEKQGWKAMPAFQFLLKLRDHLSRHSPELYRRLYAFLNKCFDSLRWFVWGENDRIPWTKWTGKPGFTKIYPEIGRAPPPTQGVVIILNPLTTHAGAVTARTQPPVLDPRPVPERATGELQRAHQATLPPIYAAMNDLMDVSDDEEENQDAVEGDGYDRRQEVGEPSLPTEAEVEYAANRVFGWNRRSVAAPPRHGPRGPRVPAPLRYLNEGYPDTRRVVGPWDEEDVIRE